MGGVGLIQAGRLDRRIDILRHSEIVTDWGDPVTTWTVVRSVRAEKLAFDLITELEGFGDASGGKAIFRIRYLSDVKLTDRISFEGQVYDIERISEIGRRGGLELQGALVPNG